MVENNIGSENEVELVEKIRRIKLYQTQHEYFNLAKAALLLARHSAMLFNKDYIFEGLLRIKPLLDTLPTEVQENFLAELLAEETNHPLQCDVLEEMLNNARSLDPKFEVQMIIRLLNRNLEKFIDSHTGKFDAGVFTIFGKIQVPLENNKRGYDTHACDMLREYVMRHQSSYFKREILLQNADTNKFKGNLSRLEPLIQHYLGYDIFFNLLGQQPDSLEKFQLLTFARRYVAANFASIRFEESIIEFPSDERTVFLMSPDYSNLKQGPAVVREIKNIHSSVHEELLPAKRLAHTETISVQEAIDGGRYFFSKSINLDNINYQIYSAKVYALVDDFLTVECNGHKFENEEKEYELSRPLEWDVTEYLIAGDNSFFFQVRNKPGGVVGVNDIPENNPYEFIFNIRIVYDLDTKVELLDLLF